MMILSGNVVRTFSNDKAGTVEISRMERTAKYVIVCVSMDTFGAIQCFLWFQVLESRSQNRCLTFLE